MGLDSKQPCTGPSGCGHPLHEHTGTHAKGTKTACRHKLAYGRGTCACAGFKGIRADSPRPNVELEASHG